MEYWESKADDGLILFGGKSIEEINISMIKHEKVMEMSSQMIINPFAGVPENERNIIDPRLKETMREFAAIDGAFVLFLVDRGGTTLFITLKIWE